MARLDPSNFGTVQVSEPESFEETSTDCDLCRTVAALPFLRKPAIHDIQRLTLREERIHREPLNSCPIEKIGYKLA